MIAPFKLEDLGCFLPNPFSDPDVVLDQLTDPAFEVQTLWHNGMAAAILCFRNYHDRCWMGFFLVAENFPTHLILRLRSHIRKTMVEKNALRLQTLSVAAECLNKWHELLGFKCEGFHEQMLYGRDYHMWALMRRGS